MRLIVSSNCTTGGVAASIKAIIPGAEVNPFPLPHITDQDKTDKLIKSLQGADVWITTGRLELADQISLKKIIQIPTIYFNAFHPDLIYARKKSTNELTSYAHYNSRIAVWAYSHGITPLDAAKLFNHKSYRSLGYFNYWDRSVKTFKQTFEKFNYSADEFDVFFNSLKRCGLFMHSVNHPRSIVFSELAKLIGKRLDASPNLINREIIIPDGLTQSIWPVYPEIGNELSIEGNYVWRVGGVEIEGLRNYVEFSYSCYEKQGILPIDLIPAQDINGKDIDFILGDQL